MDPTTKCILCSIPAWILFGFGLAMVEGVIAGIVVSTVCLGVEQCYLEYTMRRQSA